MLKANHIKQIYRHDLSSFTQMAFHQLYPQSKYLHNRHIDVMAHYLTLVSHGKIRRLIINMPPQMLKSHCVSVAWAVWELGRNPHKRILYLHDSTGTGKAHHKACLALMETGRYKALFPHMVASCGGHALTTPYAGQRRFMSFTGKPADGADILVLDVPISASDSRVSTKREALNRHFDENIMQMLNDPASGAIVLVTQRMHKGDLTHHLLENQGNWTHLSLPAVALRDEQWELPYGKVWHRRPKEPLYPARASTEQLLAILEAVGGYAFAYQYLQGKYTPQFGEAGKGTLWLSSLREGVYWDARKDAPFSSGLYHLDERRLIAARVFGTGEDPCPSDMRIDLSLEEWEIGMQEWKKERRIKYGIV